MTRFMSSRRIRTAGSVLLVAVLTLTGQITAATTASASTPTPGMDHTAGQVVLHSGDVDLTYSYDKQSVVTSIRVRGTEVLSTGAYSGLTLNGTAIDSRTLDADPTVEFRDGKLISTFRMTHGTEVVEETWTFSIENPGVSISVDRGYDLSEAQGSMQHNGQLAFGWARLWDDIRRPADGGNIPLGNAYTGENEFFLSKQNDRYGVEQSDFVMLDDKTETALSVSATSNRALATEFAYAGDHTAQETQVSADPTWKYVAGTPEQGFVYGGHSSNGTANDIYAPVSVSNDQRDTVTFHIAPADYASYRSLGGDIRGVSDIGAMESLMNDFGRSGVIDSGYGMSTVGLRNPGVGPYDMAIANRTVVGYFDPAMTRSQLNMLTYLREYAQRPDGHMHGRTYHLDHAWGDDTLADADGAYAVAVAEMYQHSGDAAWLGSMRTSAERAIEWMTTNAYDPNRGLFHNDISGSTSHRSIREWNDAVYVKWESAYVNTLMYKALIDWSRLENEVFGDPAKAAQYSDMAASLKATFNRDVDDGGLWDPATRTFAFWRTAAGEVQGKVQQTQVNLQAIVYGLADLPRAQEIIDELNHKLNLHRLPLLPLNFLPLQADTEDWAGDYFQTSLEDGAIYPFMTELYMRAAAVVGERDRSLELLQNTLKRYADDGFNGWSHLDWTLTTQPNSQEQWFPSHANAAVGLFSSVLGIQPTAHGLTITPNIPVAMNGSSVMRTIHESDSLAVTYHDELHLTVDYDATQPVTVAWPGQTPGVSYAVVDQDVSHPVAADEYGIVRYTFSGGASHDVSLPGGSATGYVPSAPPETENLALGKPVTTSSSLEDPAWGAQKVVDGHQFSLTYVYEQPAGSWGWSSNSDLTTNHQEWMTVDLGAARQIGRVVLWPRNFDALDVGAGFPAGFRIEVSSDGAAWHSVVEETNYPRPVGGGAQEFAFPTQVARFIRVVGTELRADLNGEYRMQLAEVEVESPPG